MVTRLYYNTTVGYPAVKFDPVGKGFYPNIAYSNPPPALCMVYGITSTRPGVFLDISTYTNTTTAPTAPRDIPAAYFASLPLSSSHDFTGETVKGQMRMREDSGTNDDVPQMKVFIVDGSTLAVKSTLYAGYTGAISTFENQVSTNRNAKCPPEGAVTLASLSAAAGDRIMVIPGIRAYGNNYTISYGSHYMIGSTAASDLPEDFTTATDLAPWVEFSGNLSFGADTLVSLTDDLPVANEPLVVPLPDIKYTAGFIGVNEPIASAGSAVPTTGQTWPRGK